MLGQYDGLLAAHHGRTPGTSAGHVEIDGMLRYSPIPAEVIQALSDTLPPGHFEQLTLPDCDHGIAAHGTNPLEADLRQAQRKAASSI